MKLLMTLLIIPIHLLAATELIFDKIYFNRDKIELSGLYKKGNEFLFVGDKLSNRAIYKVEFEKNRFYYKPYIDLTSLKNHNSYFAKALLLRHAGRIIHSPFDLEGITACGGTFYLVNEQVRHVLKIKENSLTKLNLDFTKSFKEAGYPLKKISTNAGFEGIAADCENKKLYIAQERSPRGIIVVDLAKEEIIETLLFENSSSKWGSLDFSDLHYENGNLYLLERNDHKITKFSLKEKKIIKSYQYGELSNGIHLRELYNTGEKYGIAEGLTFSEDRIYIGVDNNKKPISKKGSKAFNIKGKFSSILVFKRPKDF